MCRGKFLWDRKNMPLPHTGHYKRTITWNYSILNGWWKILFLFWRKHIYMPASAYKRWCFTGVADLAVPPNRLTGVIRRLPRHLVTEKPTADVRTLVLYLQTKFHEQPNLVITYPVVQHNSSQDHRPLRAGAADITPPPLPQKKTLWLMVPLSE